MRFSIDPWDPAYGATVETELALSEAQVVTDVEVPDAQWTARRPPPSTPRPAAIVFIDGVRRLEARTWIEDSDGGAVPGIFASYAAGAVRCDAQARFVDARVGRGVFAPAAELADVATRHGCFTVHRTEEATPESLVLAVHECMAACEVSVAEDARRNGDELILLDGPVRKRGHIRDAVGLVKSHHVQHLRDAALNAVVAALAPGERTPVFRIDAHPFSRYSWYVRLPGPGGSPWAGIMRCEVVGALPVSEASTLADSVTATLPRFASHAHKDRRAPQNLYPIAGLERELRRRLGDQQVLYRALRVASSAVSIA